MKSYSCSAVLCLVFLLPIQVKAQAGHQWVKSVNAIRYLATGQHLGSPAVMATGHFKLTYDFDPGPGTYNMTSKSDWDMFIQKMDDAGNLLWVKSMSSDGTDDAPLITTDATGNSYIAVTFNDTLFYDGSALFVSDATNPDLCICKLSPSGGLLWAKHIGSDNEEPVYSIGQDDMGGVYICGNYEDTVDFDPGPGTATRIAASYDGFILKLDTAGNFRWVRTIGGTSTAAYPMEMAVDDATGNIYCAGPFYNTISFDGGASPASLSAIYDFDNFICKYDSSGKLEWVNSIKETGATNVYVSGIATDHADNLYMTGTFDGTMAFDLSGPSLVTWGGKDIFTCKLNATGNLTWIKQTGAYDAEGVNDIAVDKSGHVYTTGYFYSSPLDLDPGPGIYDVNSAGENDIYVQKLDPAGNFEWARSIGGIKQDAGGGITTDNLGGIYIGGIFYGTVDFDPGPATDTLNGFPIAPNFYICKWNDYPLSIREAHVNADMKLFPNPAAGDFTIQLDRNYDELSITVYDLYGRQVTTIEARDARSVPVSLQVIPGLYTIRIHTSEQEWSKIVEIRQ